jgi:hypothetical protein
MLVYQISSQFVPGLFGRMMPLLAVMASCARTELVQTGRKMVCND